MEVLEDLPVLAATGLQEEYTEKEVIMPDSIYILKAVCN
jgi:hypothetical protein